MFNPQARWDRRMPGETHAGAEPVEVLARFSRGKVVPVSFIRGKVTVEVQRVAFAWQERKGSSLLRFFSVADGGDTYCLCFDPEHMAWRLLTGE